MSQKSDQRVQSAVVRAVLSTLGAEITRGQILLRKSAAFSAARVGCSRNTLRAIEEGKATVEIGLFLEAAALVDVPLLGGDRDAIMQRGDVARREVELLPKPHKVTEFDDDF